MILDSNVLIDLLDPEAPDAIKQRIFALQASNRPCINEVIFAELSRGYASAEEVGLMLDGLGVAVERLTLNECHRGGLAFAEYRRRGGSRETILPDFLIGAQAEMRGWPLVTRDPKGFASYFPELEIIDPMESPT